MSGKLLVSVTDTETCKTEKVETDGLLIMYLDGEKIRMIGRLEMKVLTPLIMKAMVEKMTKSG